MCALVNVSFFKFQTSCFCLVFFSEKTFPPLFLHSWTIVTDTTHYYPMPHFGSVCQVMIKRDNKGRPENNSYDNFTFLAYTNMELQRRLAVINALELSEL